MMFIHQMAREFDLNLLNNFLSTTKATSTPQEWADLIKTDSKIRNIIEKLNQWYNSVNLVTEVVVTPLPFSDEELNYLDSKFLDHLKDLEGTSLVEDDYSGYPFLNQASARGYLDILQWALPSFMDKFEHKHSRDLLQYACYHGHLPVVKWIVSQFPTVDTYWPFGDASYQGHLEILKFLEGKFPDMEVGRFPLDSACRGGFLENVEWLYSHPKFRKNVRDAFHSACICGQLEIARWLYEKESEAINNSLRHNYTGDFADICCSQKLNVAKWFVTLPFEIDVRVLSEEFPRICCRSTTLDTIKWILDNYEVNLRYHKYECIRKSLSWERIEVVSYLIGKCPELFRNSK